MVRVAQESQWSILKAAEGIVYSMNSTSCIKSKLILNLLHNLHVIRNDLQSDKTRPTEILTTVLPTERPQMNLSTSDCGAFSISVQIILVKPMCSKQITDGGI